MEGIDNYANDNIVRSVAFTALERIKSQDNKGLLEMSSESVNQRFQLLGQFQWQQDDCIEMLKNYESQKIYSQSVYYKRVDANTLHATIECVERLQRHYVIVLLLQNGLADIRYYNLKAVDQNEWFDIIENWSRSIEQAERNFATNKNKMFTGPSASKEAPDDYWGDWSSDEEDSGQEPIKESGSLKQMDNNEDSDDDDDYYNRWSKDPGTITPSQEEGRILHTVEQVEEEDADKVALTELTQMLKNSLPNQQQHGRQPIEINPLPKVVVSRQLVEEREIVNKNLRELISRAKSLGYESKDIIELVYEIM